jgi:hypothetical protein
MPDTDTTDPPDPDFTADLWAVLTNGGHDAQNRADRMVAERYGCSIDTARKMLDKIVARSAVAATNKRGAA